jgi:phosphoglycerate dehydrogenase-like enzyme
MTDPNRRPKVLIADKIADGGLELLRQHFDVDVDLGPDTEYLLSIISGYEGLVVRSATKVTAEVIDRATNLKVIARAGAGLDTIDVPAALSAGIQVVNSPDANTIAVAELTMALILALARNLPKADASLKEGRWEKSELMGTGLAGKTLGIIGFGRIGRSVAERARSFHMDILTNQRRPTPELYLDAGVSPMDLDDLLTRSDFVTIHVPATDETEGLVDADFLEKMRESAWLINTSRGSVVDEPALLAALDQDRIRGAALDVFATEPAVDSRLAQHPKVIATPHIGASTKDAQTSAAVDVAEQLIDLLTEIEPRTVLPVRVIEASKLVPHESHDDKRVDALAARLRSEDTLRNPPIVTPVEDHFVLLDGATRSEALRRAGFEHMVVQVVHADDSLQLETWSHGLLETTYSDAVAAVEATEGLFTEPSRAAVALDRLLEQGGVCALLDPGGDAAIVLAEHGVNRFQAAERATRAYTDVSVVARTLERDLSNVVAEFPDLATMVVFPHYSVEQVLLAARSGQLLPAGVTRFIVPGRVLRLDVDLDWLASDASIAEKNRELHEQLQDRHQRGEIRYYREPVYLLDE